MVHRIKKSLALCLLMISVIMIPVSAAVSVKIFSKQEALTEVNVSRPRIYIQNTGTESLTNVTYYYYFATENDKTPVLDFYYVNEHTVKLDAMGNSLYRVSYTIADTITPGQLFPDASGNVVAIHYNDWSNWDKSSDYSENNSSSFAENSKIAVYVNNVLIYGTEPVSVGNSGGNNTLVPPLLTPQLLSFALFSTDSSIVKERSIFSGGGAVGSNNVTKIGIDAIIYGNVISGGNASILQRAQIYGDVRAHGEVTTDIGAAVSGVIQQGVDVGTITLPTRSITAGTEDVTVTSSNSRPLTPGIYHDLFIDHYGTVTLSQGNYVFRKIFLETDAHVIFNTNTNELTSIDVSGDLDFSDRSTLTFSNTSYSPSVQIFTNDPDSIRIGTDVKLSGILVAPQARINMYSRSQCDGAIYAKAIVLEPDSRIMSSMVDPNGDGDGDKVPNYLEVRMGTNPADSTSYEAVAIPDESIINVDEKDVTVKYDAGVFYDDFTGNDTITVTYTKGSLTDPNNPLMIKIKSPDSSAQIPVDQDYMIVGRPIDFSGNQIGVGRDVTVTIPIPGDQLPGLYKLAMVTPSGLDIVDGADDGISCAGSAGGDGSSEGSSDGKLVVDVNSTGTYAIVRKTSKAVAYLDDGTVFSTLNASKVAIDFAINGCQNITGNTGTAVLIYTELIGNGLSNKDTVTINLENNGAGLITGKGVFFSAAGCTLVVNSLSIDIPKENFVRSNIITQGVYKVKPGQCMTISTTKSITALKASSYVPDRYVYTYSSNILVFESGSLNGEGIVRKYPNAAEPYKYNYFYKDHLGTTRMVMKDDNYLAEALMYQPYGTSSDVSIIQQPSTEPLREKFTGKEFDEEGAVFSEFQFDVFISEFTNAAGTINSVYAFYEDPATSQTFSRRYNLSVEENILRLNKKENFSRALKLKKIQIRAGGENQVINYTGNFNNLVNPGEHLRVTIAETAPNLVNNLGEFLVIGPLTMTDQVAGSRLYYFGARYLDSDMGIWLSLDPAEQFFNSYSYVGANPISKVDPNGEVAIIDDIIAGMVIAYTINMSIQAAQSIYGMFTGQIHDLDVGQLYASTIAGGVGGFFGALPGFMGKATISLIASSTSYSTSYYLFNGGKSDISTSFGVLSYNWSKRDFGYFGKNSNTPIENIGYFFGGLANISDLYALGDKYVWGGKDKGTVVYQHGTDGEGPLGDITSHAKERIFKDPNARGSHLRFESDNLDIDWGAAADNNVASSRLNVTGLDLSKSADKYQNYKPSLQSMANGINGKQFNFLYRNCGQVTSRVLTGFPGFFTPGMNYKFFFLRQLWRNFYGI